MLVFSYGSNMCLTRLQKRVPSARFIAVGKLAGHKIMFHKVSKSDGSAKANALQTQKDSDFIIGVLFDIADNEKITLDSYEGLGKGYDEKMVSILLSDNSFIAAKLYIAIQSSIDNSLSPYDWYLDFVVTGAEDYEFPNEYIEALQNVQTRIDADKKRERDNQEILSVHKQKKV